MPKSRSKAGSIGQVSIFSTIHNDDKIETNKEHKIVRFWKIAPKGNANTPPITNDVTNADNSEEIRKKNRKDFIW